MMFLFELVAPVNQYKGTAVMRFSDCLSGSPRLPISQNPAIAQDASENTPTSASRSTGRRCLSAVKRYVQSLSSCITNAGLPGRARDTQPLNPVSSDTYQNYRNSLIARCAAKGRVMNAADQAGLKTLDRIANELSRARGVPLSEILFSEVYEEKIMQGSISEENAAIADKLVKNAVQAKSDMRGATVEQRNAALEKLGHLLLENKHVVLDANAKDLETYSRRENFSENDPKFHRMRLDDKKIQGFADSMARAVASRDPLNISTSSPVSDYSNMEVSQTGKAIGIIYGIIEGRPNVILDFFAAFIKSGNVGIVRAGSEVPNTARALLGLIHQALSSAELPTSAYQMPSSQDREISNRLLEKRGEIDLVVPRGGYQLVNHVRNTTQIPTISHPDGVCHMYFDQGIAPENLEKAVDAAAAGKLHAKGGVCGSTEGFLLDKNLGQEKLKFVLSELARKLASAQTTFHADQEAFEILSQIDLPAGISLVKATREDYGKEYLTDKHCLVAMVDGVGKALEHINEYGSGHTDSCLTDNLAVWDTFKKLAKSVVLTHNAQTSFSDAEVLLKLIEVGIAVPGSITTAEQLLNRVLIVKGDYRVRGITDAILEERAAAAAA